MKLAEIMLETAAMSSGGRGAGALRGGVAAPLPGDAVEGVGLGSVAAWLFVFFCFGGKLARKAVPMSL